jgi:excisionase family DNA binding protein
MAQRVTRKRAAVARKQPAATPRTNGHAVGVEPGGMTYEEAGRYLGCTDRMVRQLVAAGKLPAYYIGRSARVSRAACDRFMAEGGAPNVVDP